MNCYDDQFLGIFNEYYPYERYILKEPKPINYLFDDALLLEVFIPSTEIKPVLNPDNSLLTFTKINEDEVYIKIQSSAGIMRFSYFDFSDGIRETIRNLVMDDFGDYEWESLYVDHEDGSDSLKSVFKLQESLILEKYGVCNFKDNYKIERD